eukprot:347985-Heterocapsa_arctica.AAC.1
MPKSTARVLRDRRIGAATRHLGVQTAAISAQLRRHCPLSGGSSRPPAARRRQRSLARSRSRLVAA